MKPNKVRLFEVGPRDGLQNEKHLVPTQKKVRWILRLLQAGLKDIEVGAFVRSERVPQMADSAKVLAQVLPHFKKRGARAWVLVPNNQGLENAQIAGAKNIAVFTAATESFNRANIGMSVQESLQEIKKILRPALRARMNIRGYVSTVFGCPFEGEVSLTRPQKVIESLLDFGISEISIGDTIGVADPARVEKLLRSLVRRHGAKPFAVHFHDTRGGALANTLRALDCGIQVIDASAGGLGGCPFAPGASGNLATEDLVYMLKRMGISTGVDLKKLSQASLDFFKGMHHPPSSRYLAAFQRARPQMQKIF